MTFDELVNTARTPVKIQQFLDCYSAARTDAAAASKEALPLRLFAPLMPNIILIECLDSDHMIYKIAGENIIARMGFNPKGLNLLDVLPVSARDISKSIQEMLFRYPCGFYFVYENSYASGNRSVTETILLPLSKRLGTQPNLFLTYNIHHAPTGVTESGGKMKLVNRFETGAFIDIGSGAPSSEEAAALKQKVFSALEANGF